MSSNMDVTELSAERYVVKIYVDATNESDALKEAKNHLLREVVYRETRSRRPFDR